MRNERLYVAVVFCLLMGEMAYKYTHFYFIWAFEIHLLKEWTLPCKTTPLITNIMLKPLILIVFSQAILALHGVDIQSLTSAANLECLKEQRDVSFLIMRGYRMTGTPDPNLPALIKAAHQANITNIHISMYPCRSKDAEYQADQIVNYLNTTHYEMIWISL